MTVLELNADCQYGDHDMFGYRGSLGRHSNLLRALDSHPGSRWGMLHYIHLFAVSFKMKYR